MANLKSYSYSAMSAYLRCGVAFKFRYVDGLPGKLTGDLIRGNAYHNAVGSVLAEKLVFNTMPTLESAIKCYNDTWNNSVNKKVVDEDGRMIQRTEIDFRGDTPESVRAGGQSVLELYYKDYIPKLKPREIEVWKRINFHGINLNGKIDVIEQDYTIIDHKTAERSLNIDSMDTEYQSCWYAILTGMEECNFQLHQAVIKKVPEINILPVKRTKEDVKWVGDLICKTWAAIQSDIFLPTGLHSYFCGPKSCAYWNECHHKTVKPEIIMPDDF
ncbi:MAG: PD-(D/E)XK nuclease family protein [Candidatus Omnitrophota bacterium]|jgi:hypothetical protein